VPLSSAEKWADAYRSHGGRVEMHVDDNGHHTGDVEERARRRRDGGGFSSARC
jgi:hypothetical protein